MMDGILLCSNGSLMSSSPKLNVEDHSHKFQKMTLSCLTEKKVLGKCAKLKLLYRCRKYLGMVYFHFFEFFGY